MMLAMSALVTSKSGLPHLSAAWPNAAMGAPHLPESLAAQIAKLDPLAFSRALDGEILAAAGEYAQGLTAYRRHDYRRAADAAPVIWRRGSAELYDHGGGDGVPVLFAPSLINRGFVLDLVPGQGMLSWLAGQGLHPYRMEWGAPVDDERAFTVADYVRLRLEPAMDAVLRRSGRPIVLAGYCMGGLLTIAEAIRRPEAISALVLLATPWDFHAAGADRGNSIASLYRSCRPFLHAWGELPVDIIQALFAAHDPMVSLGKFRRFSTLAPDSDAARAFVALEDWLNDGVALPIRVADEALLDWYGANATGRGVWRVGADAVDPAALSMPTLVVVPGADRIVPPASAAALMPHLAHGHRLDLALGHIGMVVGRRAKAELWRPMADWINAQA
jgi:polyhydroxyalkanoate synthase